MYTVPEAKLQGKKCKQQVLYIFIAGLLPNANASVKRFFTSSPPPPSIHPFPRVPSFLPYPPLRTFSFGPTSPLRSQVSASPSPFSLWKPEPPFRQKTASSRTSRPTSSLSIRMDLSFSTAVSPRSLPHANDISSPEGGCELEVGVVD